MDKESTEDFGRIRGLLWPIYRHEQRMLIPMFLMILFICFNYSVLRNMKDALVVTAKASGAEVIPFIKVWCMLPMAVLVTLLYTKLSSWFSQERVFYMIISGFLLYFAAFLIYLYPNQEALHPHYIADKLEAALPGGFRWLIVMLRNWTLTSFYVIAELWGCIVLTVLFWSLANEVTRIGDAKRFYAVLAFGGNFAAMLAGQFPTWLQQLQLGDSVVILLTCIIVSGLATMAIFYWMNRKVFNSERFADLHEVRAVKRKKRMSIRDSMSQLAGSKYLLCIAALVIGYNLVINLVEVVWKDQLKQLYPAFEDYNAYLGHVTTVIGILSMFVATCIPYFISRLGWTRTAMITPVTILITGMGFFSLMFFKDALPAGGFALLGATPLAVVVLIGAIQNCLSKGCKYSVFDATKEMAFIPLDHETKLKGKAAIDGIGSRVGKSGGSLLHQGLLLMFSTLAASGPYVAAILLVVIVLWMVATRSLGRQLHILVSEQGEEIGEDGEEDAVKQAVGQELMSEDKAPATTAS